MKEGRSIEGKFTKGHAGFKPKGALSKKKQKLDQRLDLLFAQLDMRMEETIQALSPKQVVKPVIDLNKLVLPKLRRIPYVPPPPEESEEKDKKVIFEVVNSAS